MFSNLIPNFVAFENLIVLVTEMFFHSSSTNPIVSEVFIPPRDVIDTWLELTSSFQFITFSFESNSNILSLPTESTVLPEALAKAENIYVSPALTEATEAGCEPELNPRVYEILPTSKYTAYSENKGEKLAFCTTKEKGGNNLIDENTLTFVALHELSHIATKSIGHTSEFWNNFKFILKEAVPLGVYKAVNYKEKPTKYCSMKITDNPYYDL